MTRTPNGLGASRRFAIAQLPTAYKTNAPVRRAVQHAQATLIQAASALGIAELADTQHNQLIGVAALAVAGLAAVTANSARIEFDVFARSNERSMARGLPQGSR